MRSIKSKGSECAFVLISKAVGNGVMNNIVTFVIHNVIHNSNCDLLLFIIAKKKSQFCVMNDKQFCAYCSCVALVTARLMSHILFEYSFTGDMSHRDRKSSKGLFTPAIS